MDDLDEFFYHYHYEPQKHQRMSIYHRSAQFASFKALTGYEDEIKEKERTTINKRLLFDEEKQELDYKLNDLLNKKVSIEYFIKDYIKCGGNYSIKEGYIKKIDYIKKIIIFDDNTFIKSNNIIEIKELKKSD